LRALLLEEPDSAYRILVPFVSALVLVGVFIGVFMDDDATEVVSAIVLLITSVICRRILDVRRAPGTWMFAGPTRIWALISLGFMFLAIDELLSLHEKMDRLIHLLLGLEETGWSDRIDDFIIFLYGLIGAGLMYLHRTEFRGLARFYRYLVIGFVLMFLSVLFDAANNRHEIADLLGWEGQALAWYVEITKDGEEILKVLAEVFFLFGFLSIFKHFFDERDAAAHRPPSPTRASPHWIGAGTAEQAGSKTPASRSSCP